MTKYGKFQNIESYPVAEVIKLWSMYLDYLENNDNKDLDFPDLNIKFD